MKICYIAADVPVPYPLGSSTHVYELARNLIMLGHEVHLVTRRVSMNQPSNEQRDGINIYRLHRGIIFSPRNSSVSELNRRSPFREGSTHRTAWRLYEFYLMTSFAWYAGLEAARIIKEKGLDVILERESSFGAGVIASYITSRPLFLEVIGYRQTRSQLRRSRKIMAYSSSVLMDSTYTTKLEIVTAAANCDLFQGNPQAGKEIRLRYGIGDVPVVGYVGSFHERHGMSELVDAAVRILKRNPAVKFLMVGPYYQSTLARATSLGVANSFVFSGAVEYEDVPKFMSACDVLVAPYNPSKLTPFATTGKRTLGSPLKVFEYMASGKPLVSTSVDPISSVIQDHITGILVAPGDSSNLAGAISELLEDPVLAKRIAENARKELVEKYSWNAVARKISRVMESPDLQQTK